MSLNASVGPFDACSRCRPGSSAVTGVMSSLPNVSRVYVRSISALRVRRRNVVDEARQHREREIAVTLEPQRGQFRGTERRIALRHRESAVGRETFEQDRAERLRVVGPRAARADVAHQFEFFQPDAHDLAVDGRQRLDLRDRVDHALLDRAVREQDDVGLLLAFGGLLLDHRVDRDLAIGEDARDVGEHAGPVLHAHPQVIARLDLAHRQERHVGQLVGLEGEVRHAMLGIGGVHPRHVDEVGDHRARRRLGARAGAVVQRRPDRVALHQHRVHHALDVGDQPLRRDQRRMDAQLDAGGACAA